MPIANYSTTVNVMKTLGDIQGMLVSHGARSIIINYSSDKEPESLSFLINTQFGEMPFHLPANIDRIVAVMNRGKTKSSVSREQAARVGWRIIRDWVRAQVAIIETEMVTVEQVFLPYMETKTGKSLYEIMVENRLQISQGNQK